MTPVRLEPMAPLSRVKHSTTEPLHSPDLGYTLQGSYASGKCQGNLNFFKVREFYVVSGKHECLLKCQGILQFPACII